MKSFGVLRHSGLKAKSQKPKAKSQKLDPRMREDDGLEKDDSVKGEVTV
ncbi:hypothetical protein L2744_16950 [Shewanella profunda]|nr:hypothetical protein [Shewanella profunda]MCL1091260.1 hypothetical protein [Shewanella profunda]